MWAKHCNCVSQSCPSNRHAFNQTPLYSAVLSKSPKLQTTINSKTSGPVTAAPCRPCFGTKMQKITPGYIHDDRPSLIAEIFHRLFRRHGTRERHNDRQQNDTTTSHTATMSSRITLVSPLFSNCCCTVLLHRVPTTAWGQHNPR